MFRNDGNSGVSRNNRDKSVDYRFSQKPHEHANVFASSKFEVAKWISDLIGKHGLDKLVQATGKSGKQLRRYADGTSEPPLSVALALAKLNEQPLERILDTEGEDGTKFALVPRLSVRAAAGAGAVNYEVEEVPDAMLAFRLVWLRQHGIDPRNAAIITAHGDSMEPTIRHGDALLINTAIQDVRSEGIYVVRVEDTLLVKRISIGLDHITLISDNPAIKDEVITKDRLPDLHIVGRVVWFGREI